MKEFVERFGYEAGTAADGREALKLVGMEPFDLIITDIQMPDISGLELIDNIRKSYPDIELIAVTGYNMEYRYTDVINVGATDFITKPIDANELHAKMLRIFRERDLRAELRRLTIRDVLTDLYNRRFFDERGKEEVARAIRQKFPLFLIFIDIDKFKHFNDKFGHQAGDGVLRFLADVITSSIRKDVDISFRYGGDEFGVLVPQVSVSQAKSVAERIRRKYLRGKYNSTSLSLGLAQLQDSGTDHEEHFYLLIKRADEALYSAKKQGGNQVTVYSDDA
jgi:diguanylate cyclase (GGDEF)-like protein